MKLVRFVYPANSAFGELESVFGTAFPAFARCGGACDTESGEPAAVTPTTRLAEDADSYRATVELPGVRKEDVRLELENDTLTVTAKRVEKTAEGEATAEYRRRLPVPDDVAADKITAAHENGVLTLTLPKKEAAKPRQIEVK